MQDMSLTIAGHDIQQLMRHIEARMDLKKVAATPSSYWASMALCIIDSVWSIRSNYEKTVCPLVRRFAKSKTPPWDSTDHSTPPSDGSPPLETSWRSLRDACKTDTLTRPFLQIASGHRRGAESSKLMQFTVLLMRFLALESTGPAIYEMLPD